MLLNRKRIKLGDFDVHVPKGHEQIIDSDATTKYLFINGPRDIYTVYFDSTMPFYTDRIIKDYVEGCKLELKLNDRKISFFYSADSFNKNNGLWYFNIDFFNENKEIMTLPGQVIINSKEFFRKVIHGKLPFVQILEKIKLK